MKSLSASERTFSVENNLLAILFCFIMIHTTVSRLSYDFLKRLSVVGEYAKERGTARSRSAQYEKLIDQQRLKVFVNYYIPSLLGSLGQLRHAE